MSDRTLVLLKPDAIERGLVGEILGRFEAKNLKIVALDLRSLDPEVLAELTVFAAGVARAIRQAIPCKRVGAAVIGLEVPHAHLHLVPLQTVGDINFERPKLKPTADELAAVAARIVAAYRI